METNQNKPTNPEDDPGAFDDHLTKLTARQKRFCQEYVILGVATRAYRRAYGETNAKGQKRSQGAIQHAAKDLMGRPKIKKEIQALQDAANASLAVTQEQVAAANIRAGFVDIADFFTQTDDGKTRCLHPNELTPEVRNCVVGFEVEQHEIRPRGQPAANPDVLYELVTIKYKLTDPLKARDSLAKMMGWDKPVKPIELLLEYLSPELRARVWAELEPIIKRESA